MDYSKIRIAERVLEVADLPIPKSETEIRELAYMYLLEKDFLAAHQIRLGKNYGSFTRSDLEEIIKISGEYTVRNNISLFVRCMKAGLLK